MADEELLKAIKKILNALGEYFVQAFKFLFQRHPVATSGVVALLLAATLLGIKYVSRSSQYEEIVTSTMEANLENTPQTYKALEAFILAGVSPEVQDAVQSAALSSDIKRNLLDLDKIMRPNAGQSLNSLVISIPPNTTLPKSEEAVVTDRDMDGFLFVPLRLVRAQFTAAEFDQMLCESATKPADGCKKGKTTTITVQKDPRILDDILTSQSLIGQFKTIVGSSVFGAPVLDNVLEQSPVQVYYLSGDGVNRIVDSTSGSANMIYAKQFVSSTYFPSRPYYLDTMADDSLTSLDSFKEHPKSLVKEVFHVTKPYFDIGGHGIVVTLSIPFHYPNHTSGIICLDFPIKQKAGLGGGLEARVKALEGSVVHLNCLIGSKKSVSCNSEGISDMPKDVQDEIESKLTSQIQMNQGSLSQMGGNLRVLKNSEKKPVTLGGWGISSLYEYINDQIDNNTRSSFYFSVPEKHFDATKEGDLVISFVGISLNLNQFLFKTGTYGIGSMVCLLLAIMLLTSSWYGDALRKRDWQESFKEVGRVMLTAATPYVRLDSDDKIVSANIATCKLLGYDANLAGIAELTGKKFGSFVAESSVAAYVDVQAKRKSNQVVGEYSLNMISKAKVELQVTVHSAKIPSTGDAEGELPQTFGILTQLS